MSTWTFPDPWVQTYSDFWLDCLDPEFHRQTCGYWYTITSGSMAHTAFVTSKDLMAWLEKRGLRLSDELPTERGTYKSIYIEGTYRRASYMNVGAFRAVVPLLKIAELENARYTLGKVTQDADGFRTVHYLNINVSQRIEFLYEDARLRKTELRQIIETSPDTQGGDESCAITRRVRPISRPCSESRPSMCRQT